MSKHRIRVQILPATMLAVLLISPAAAQPLGLTHEEEL